MAEKETGFNSIPKMKLPHKTRALLSRLQNWLIKRAAYQKRLRLLCEREPLKSTDSKGIGDINNNKLSHYIFRQFQYKSAPVQQSGTN
ncbi:hypothetical protein CEXT_699331 [Caerostris extrusa]|uniref:Uncharacterized protein n=1 Tax=Caerostris extrusa TaxID=172846 RepID=A0AAV4SL35_CAEEX|nr:hypothetical protein CEXT_699331 [Caerostris extrusa]